MPRITRGGRPRTASAGSSAAGDHDTDSLRFSSRYRISFRGAQITFEELFGTKPISVNRMARTLWDYVATHKRGRRLGRLSKSPRPHGPTTEGRRARGVNQREFERWLKIPPSGDRGRRIYIRMRGPFAQGGIPGGGKRR